jgi:hypothetical protein
MSFVDSVGRTQVVITADCMITAWGGASRAQVPDIPESSVHVLNASVEFVAPGRPR